MNPILSWCHIEICIITNKHLGTPMSVTKQDSLSHSSKYTRYDGFTIKCENTDSRYSQMLLYPNNLQSLWCQWNYIWLHLPWMNLLPMLLDLIKGPYILRSSHLDLLPPSLPITLYGLHYKGAACRESIDACLSCPGEASIIASGCWPCKLMCC